MTAHQTRFATSADGTPIAYERLGDGPPLVVVSGILCDRNVTRALAERLAEWCTVLHYDRRGRGASGDTSPYAVAREVEDLAALIAAAGGAAAVYGHSSGAGLALHAAASGLPITGSCCTSRPTGVTTRRAGEARAPSPRRRSPRSLPAGSRTRCATS